MSPSRRELIIDQVASTVRSVVNPTYETGLTKVIRTFRATDVEEIPYACVIAVGERKEYAKPYNFLRCYLQVAVWIFLVTDYSNDDNADQRLNRAIADVEKAILNAQTLRGGSGSASIVDWCHVVGNEVAVFGEQTPIGVARVDLELCYLHKDTDPDAGRS